MDLTAVVGGIVELLGASAAFFEDGILREEMHFSPNDDNFGWLLDTGKSVQIAGGREGPDGYFVFGGGTRMMRIDIDGNLLIPRIGGGSSKYKKCNL